MSAHSIIRRTGITLAAAALAAALLPAEAQTGVRGKTSENRVVRIVANGSDGETSFYGVRCANGKHGDVRLEHETEHTCAVPQQRDTQCRKRWTIQKAAEHVCAGGR